VEQPACQPRSAAFEPCAADHQCELGLFCDDRTCRGGLGSSTVVQPLPAAGESCTSVCEQGLACVMLLDDSGLPTGTCAQPLAEGGSCILGNPACEIGLKCVGGGGYEYGECVPALPEGAECGNDPFACASANCVDANPGWECGAPGMPAECAP
jgi:hypothetical protein